jgi:hypothetical protein
MFGLFGQERLPIRLKASAFLLGLLTLATKLPAVALHFCPPLLEGSALGVDRFRRCGEFPRLGGGGRLGLGDRLCFGLESGTLGLQGFLSCLE